MEQLYSNCVDLNWFVCARIADLGGVHSSRNDEASNMVRAGLQLTSQGRPPTAIPTSDQLVNQLVNNFS
eukprot:996101-Amphidinium_carterae.1